MNRRNKQSGSAFIGLLVVMAIVYFALLSFSLKGWGYMGYGGFYRGPSFMYFGGPNVYHSPTTREGSVSGPGNRGGGYSGGK